MRWFKWETSFTLLISCQGFAPSKGFKTLLPSISCFTGFVSRVVESIEIWFAFRSPNMSEIAPVEVMREKENPLIYELSWFSILTRINCFDISPTKNFWFHWKSANKIKKNSLTMWLRTWGLSWKWKWAPFHTKQWIK